MSGSDEEPPSKRPRLQSTEHSPPQSPAVQAQVPPQPVPQPHFINGVPIVWAQTSDWLARLMDYRCPWNLHYNQPRLQVQKQTPATQQQQSPQQQQLPHQQQSPAVPQPVAQPHTIMGMPIVWAQSPDWLARLTQQHLNQPPQHQSPQHSPQQSQHYSPPHSQQTSTPEPVLQAPAADWLTLLMQPYLSPTPLHSLSPQLQQTQQQQQPMPGGCSTGEAEPIRHQSQRRLSLPELDTVTVGGTVGGAGPEAMVFDVGTPQRAFRRALLVQRYTPRQHTDDLIHFLQALRPVLRGQLEQLLTEHHGLKLWLSVQVT